MKIGESTLTNAIRYCLRKYCEANIIIAGPIGAGKHELCELVKDWFENIGISYVSLFFQDDYYKELQDIPKSEYGAKLDLMDSFETEELIDDVKKLYELEYTYVPVYDFNIWSRKFNELVSKSHEKVKLVRKRNINIFAGIHAITLLKDIVPNAITIYVNTDTNVCIQRRVNQRMFCPCPYELPKSLQMSYYEDFIIPQIQTDILPQLDLADIVIKN